MKKLTAFVIFSLWALLLVAQNSVDPNGYNVFYHPNGQKSSEGMLVNGKPDGWWKAYNMQGNLISEGNRKNFLLDSVWTFFNDNGNKVLVIHYLQGKKDGERIQYFEHEYVIDHWKEDTLIGNTTYYDKDGWMKKTTPYVDGKAHGMEKEFTATGEVVATAQYYRGVLLRREFINRTDANGLKQGNWKGFWENGLLAWEGTYVNNKKKGFFKQYDTLGNFLLVEKYENDRLIEDAPETKKLELKTNYHRNGKPAVTATFYKGVPEGIRREYDTDGNVISGAVYENGILRFEGITDLNGKRQGLWKEYYPSGEIRATGYYKNGYSTGDWRFFFQDKTVEIIGGYDAKGNKEGEWIWFYPSGDTLMVENYTDGVEDGRFVEYGNNGDIVSQGSFLEGNEEGVWHYYNGGSLESGSYFDGTRQGLWRVWYVNGTIASELEYEQGLPNGKSIDYWENGTVKFSGRYLTGMRTGLWYKYDENGSLILTTQYKNGRELKWNSYLIDD